MKNKKCENCMHWTVTSPPSIGKCRPENKTTIFNHSCSQYVPNQINDMADNLFGNNQQFKDIFGEVFKAK